ncbi:ROK family protein [Planosporangium thailandense]|uniref:ROK family protein n=1 Tax=Planosporangium thailandense TaxID=765197 RepID=A0ABX0XQX4_9ACTN|nr:ROK family transcriptional regulator [Planosporangium thailandense]NJC68384.1 ROK family protein [Planosporangium thailandense]
MTGERADATVLWDNVLAGNARRVGEVLRAYGPRTRSELVTLTGLSRPTVAAGLTDLTDAGLVTEQPAPSARPAGGRPAAVVRLTRAAGLALGVDLGRRHIRVAVADLGHAILAERAARLDLDADDHPAEVLDLVTDLVDRTLEASCASRCDVVGVGLGIPAPVTRQGGIGSAALFPAWADLSPGEELAARLGLPVRVDNDANLGALAEYAWGAGQGCPDLVYVKIATGIGAGIVLDGRLYRGTAGTAGELGHVTLDARGPVCRCGNRGCLELLAGGRALLENARLTRPEVADLEELVRLATDGDTGCRRLLIDAATQLGYALGGLVNLLNPARIVLGGDLGAAAGLMREPLRRGLGDTAMAAPVRAVQVVPAQFDLRASALGGVALALGVDGAPLGVDTVAPIA